MMPRSPRPPRAKLHRPSAPSSQSRTSPPSSPNLAASTSVDDHLDGSFLLVSGGVNNTEAVCGEDDEISSNVGSSLRDSLIGDLLSDTSEEPAGREAWEGSTDGGDVDHPPNPWLGGSSFIDAEATATEDSSSANQLHESTFSSQVKLIMPALEASGLTSDGSTPNESLANLLNIPHVQRSSTPACSTQRRRATSPSGRGVEPSWLEASSRLWNVSPELGNILGEGGEYWLLASTDRKPKQMTEEPKEAMSESHLQASLTQAEKPRGYVEAVDQQLRRALFSADMVGLSGKTKRWMSVLALASVLSLALFRSFGPSAAILPSDRTDEDSPDLSELKTNVPSNTGEPFSLWHHLPVSQLGPTGPVAAVSSPASIKTLSPNAPVLGSAIRDNALTTNPVKAGNVEPCAHSDSASVPHRKRRDVMASMSCCSLSIRDSQVALTTVTTALSTTDGSWSKTWRKKIMREPTSIAIVNVTAPAPARQCTLSQHVRSEMMAQFTAISAPAMTFAISASRYLNHVYAPALAELQKELAELLALAHAIAETTSTLSQLVINRAARGFSISRQALHSATSRLPKYASPSNSMTEASRIMSNHTAIWDAVVIARDSVEALSDYMEDHAAALSDFVEDQAIVIQEKGIKSLRRAKQGLNKLIAEAKKLKGDPGEEKVGRTDVGKEGPMPFTRMHRRAGRAPFARTSRLVSSRLQPRQRHSRRAERCIKRTLPPPETPSRSRRFWDMVHHGVVAFVL